MAVLWPKRLLPNDLGAVQILTWGYDADVDHFVSSASRNLIPQHASDLLRDLVDQRRKIGLQNAKLIFAVHILGGPVVKEALIQSAQTSGTDVKTIAPHTQGIVFLGTPHRGSATASLGEIAYRISRVYFKRPNTGLLSSLKRRAPDLERIADIFGQLILQYDVRLCSFYEALETRKWTFLSSIVVESEYAKMRLPAEGRSSIPASHSKMTNFVSARDIGYIRVSSTLQKWVEETRHTTDQGQ